MIPSRRQGLIVAIDPDIGKNGVAIISRSHRTCELYSLTFPEVIDKVRGLFGQEVSKECYRLAEPAETPIDVIVEAGWLNKGNWHVTESRNGKRSPSAWAAAVGKSDGECSAVSKKLLECFQYYGIEARPLKPLLKCWKGKDRKITQPELRQEMELYRVNFPYNKTNQETRDAALIALVNL